MAEQQGNIEPVRAGLDQGNISDAPIDDAYRSVMISGLRRFQAEDGLISDAAITREDVDALCEWLNEEEDTVYFGDLTREEADAIATGLGTLEDLGPFDEHADEAQPDFVEMGVLMQAAERRAEEAREESPEPELD